MRSTRTVAQKMGIKPGWTAHLVNAPDGAADALGLPEVEMVEHLAGELDYIHLFVRTQERLRAEFPRVVPHVAPQGELWVSWPKAISLVPT